MSIRSAITQNKLITLSEAVREHTHDGQQIATNGLPVGAEPVAFARELLRQKRKNLHVVSTCASSGLNLLCGAGAVSKMEGGFSGLEVFGFSNGIRRAVESGQAVWEDYSNLAMPLRYLAGALNLPFFPANVCIGSDIRNRSAFGGNADGNEKIPLVSDPFTGKKVGALSPLKPDLAVIYVPFADAAGNAIILGSEWASIELSRAAKKLIIIADNIVDEACIRQYPNLVKIPAELVTAVVWHPFAAWPNSSPGLYDSDEAHVRELNAALKTEAGTREYIEKFVVPTETPQSLRKLIGEKKIAGLTATPSAFLADPYRKWILPEEETEKLLNARKTSIEIK